MSTTKFKVCHLTSAHPYNDTRIFLKQCTSLSKFYSVFLINTNSPIDLKIDNGINLININYTAKNRLQRFLISTYKVYKAAKKLNADIYHFHDPELIPYAILLRLKRKKVIYDVHESYSAAILDRNYIPKFLRKFIAIPFNILEKISSIFFNFLITATPYINKEFKYFNKKTQTINNYPILNELNIENKNCIKENAICFVGCISKERGFYEMIEATKRTDTTLYIGGELSKEFSTYIKNYNHVNSLGFISRKEFSDLMNKCIAGFVLYHPCKNHINAQPNKLFEYMSANLPVICSNFPLWKNIVEKHNCGKCCDPLDIQSIINSIEWIKNNQSNIYKVGNNGRTAVKKIFNWEIEEKKLVSIYNKLIA